MAQINVKIDAKGAFQLLRKESMRINKAGRATIEDLVTLGVVYAKTYVPKDTQTTFRSIKGRINSGDQNSSGSVYIEERTVLDKSPRKNSRPRTTHDLAFFMARGLSGRGRGGHSHFKTGNPRFMERTREYLNTKKREIGNKNIKKGNGSTGTSV